MSNTKDNSIISDLFSNVDSVVLNTLYEISESGRVHFIPVLAELLNTTENNEIKTSIVKLFSELKQTAAVPVLMETIKNNKFVNVLELIVRSCWENGLDYSPFIYDFAELLIKGNYMTAFESYTVIMNTEGNISRENAGKSIDFLKKNVSEVPTDRIPLVEDVITFLNDYK
ncbi:MAG: hypothetical protein KA807_05430 [Prolixibacteraceae bacterium]|nr:hypothetical protein [Prolixibacteraceae bacterium]